MKSKTWVINLSMTKIAKAKTKEPTITTIVLRCKLAQEGQVARCTNSTYDSLMYLLIVSISFFCYTFLARVERFELPSMVLETTILPLNYTRMVDMKFQKTRIAYPFPVFEYYPIIFQLPDQHQQYDLLRELRNEALC